MASKKKKDKSNKIPPKGESKPVRSIAENRKARFNYHVVEDYEVGIVLQGSEVKSLRQGRVNFQDAYARFIKGELFLVNLNIAEYKQANIQNHSPKRRRKLLLHKRELKKLESRVHESGFTLIPLALYFKESLVKVKLGLCRGKREYDKRETVKARETDRELARYIRKQ
jgi:SsrA-binding protein